MYNNCAVLKTRKTSRSSFFIPYHSVLSPSPPASAKWSQVAAVVFYSLNKMSILQDLLDLLDIENLLSLDVLYMDIVRMIKLYAVWTLIVVSAVA